MFSRCGVSTDCWLRYTTHRQTFSFNRLTSYPKENAKVSLTPEFTHPAKDVPSSPPVRDPSADVAATIFLYIFEYRLFLFLFNLVAGALFLLFLHSLPWLERRGMNLRWFRRYCRDSDNDTHRRWHNSVRSYWKRIRLPQAASPKCWRRPSITSLFHSTHSSKVSAAADTESGELATRPMDPTFVTPFINIEPSASSLLRSNSDTSKRSSLMAGAHGTSRGSGRRLEPLRRSLGSANPNTLLHSIIIVSSDTESMIDEGTFDESDTPDYWDKEALYLTPPGLSTPTDTDSDAERSSVDLSDMRAMESPISLHIEGSPVVAEFGDQRQASFPGRHRPPTYGTVFSQQSIMTLPVYREQEQEDDRMSVASRAPTYRSHRSTRAGPRLPFRSTRPPLPAPPPMASLPNPPSSYYYATFAKL
ncbi:hypothetical protein NP233_g4394 [Leucocoprinus birnbaumii]|uniref:Uncharacterized protein n=1 Tax=Leucocoprinus birnbaumii TaxID=56174 RepID=A0AAD5VV40_9AGAR|nr:hypothetical protein NP233_g4394 [Leucocoprinus birnbaumii]